MFTFHFLLISNKERVILRREWNWKINILKPSPLIGREKGINIRSEARINIDFCIRIKVRTMTLFNSFVPPPLLRIKNPGRAGGRKA
jgi:hypothetical protein